jgi:ATP-binding cassette subfamily B protein
VRFIVVLGWQAGRRRMLIVGLLPLVTSALLGASLVVMRDVLGSQMLSSTAGSHALGQLIFGLAVLAALGLVTHVLGAVTKAQQAILQVQVGALATDKIAAAASAVDLIRFEDPGFHDRIEQAVWAARGYAGSLLTMLASVLTTFTSAAGVMTGICIFDWWLGPLVTLAAMPALRTSMRRRRAEFALRVELLENRRATDYLTSVLTGRDTAKEVRAYRLEAPLRDRLAARQADAVAREASFQKTFMFQSIRARLAGDLILAAVAAGMIALHATGHLDLATTATALAGAFLLATQLRSVSNMTGSFGTTVLFTDALREFTRDAPPPARTPAPVPDGFTALEADRISFSYPAAHSPALEGVTVRLRAGQVIALVGENGSGKTTLAKILAGLYQPDTGTVRWDGQPVTDMARLRAVSTVLFQDFARYKLSAADNIGLGRPDRAGDHDAIVAAARRAGAHELLTALPGGYASMLSSEFTGGTDLSLGQWQRVALARAYFRDAPFIVLDEPTAALDPRAEAELFASVRDLYAGRTVLLITHRFSTVRHADYIYVLDHGQIAEEGTHDELMAEDGGYAAMFSTQAAAYIGPVSRLPTHHVAAATATGTTSAHSQ